MEINYIILENKSHVNSVNTQNRCFACVSLANLNSHVMLKINDVQHNALLRSDHWGAGVCRTLREEKHLKTCSVKI